MFSNLNYLAVFVSGLVYWIVGGVWYAAIFSKQYQAALNFSPEEKDEAQKDFPKALGMHFLSGLITSLILANLVRFMGANSFLQGVTAGFWIWLGFALTINLNYLLFERRPKVLFFVNTGFFLIAFVVMGGVLAVWQ
ncbi:DUF1761 domain-containing protein [candidate division KSB1 bacterium]|nr:DUF1761 domain-containing protein [candidate division KSB1 bacterium]NIR72105.1 DUF1761 domain-containing protein [candidate division KSB1 bacterium]NIS26047.1 DUF1761 domain-containing protein [candidate division KSB1 bacterium]NIT71938.1 DUF1761 domain-containing protein [candidate division KSB1 bacterium]NIU25682.1 DUF1761 domain-containing protein [candidate division KSB1 bacterium]